VAAAKKKTRKELLKEPDEFITVSSRLVEWFSRYRRELSAVVIGVVALAVVFSGYRFFTQRAEARSAAALEQAVSKYQRLAREQSPEAARQAVADEFGAIVAAYGGRSGGKLARLMLADMRYASGEFRRAAELYAAAQDDFKEYPSLRCQVLISLGHAHEALKEDAAALGYYERALPAASPAQKAEVLFHIGRILERQGNTDKSLESFRRIIAEHADSFHADMLRERIGG
jgi:tetratricopeptide (TPR) repeat protein